MPVSMPSTMSNDLEERLLFLRPYIIWRRRKRRLEETRLLEEIIAEENRNITIRREKRMEERKLHEEKKLKLEEELEEVKQKTEELEKRLRGLNDEKHELFMKLKCVLMTEDSQKKMRQMKDNNPQHVPVPGQQPTLGQGAALARGLDVYHQNQVPKRSGSAYHSNADISTSHPSASTTNYDVSYNARGSGMQTYGPKPQSMPRYDGTATHGQGNVPRPPFLHRTWHAPS